MDSDDSFNIIGTKWNKIDSEYGLDKTIIFEINGKAYMMDKVISDEPIEFLGKTYDKGSIIISSFTYTFNENTWIGKLEAIDEDDSDGYIPLGADFYILKNGTSMLVKNGVVESTYSKK